MDMICERCGKEVEILDRTYACDCTEIVIHEVMLWYIDYPDYWKSTGKDEGDPEWMKNSAKRSKNTKKKKSADGARFFFRKKEELMLFGVEQISKVTPEDWEKYAHLYQIGSPTTVP